MSLVSNVILSDHDEKLLKDLFELDVDFRSNEELFLKVKENVVSFYRDKFGFDVNDRFDDISFSSIATSEYWEKIYGAVLDLLYSCLYEGKGCADIEKLKEIYTILKDKVNDNNRSTFISHGGSNFRYIRSEMMELKAKFSAIFGKDEQINSFLNDFFVGAFYIGCNLDGKPSKYVFFKKQSCKPDVIELLATHEINHAIESSILYEDNNFVVYTSGWKIHVENKKKANGNSNLMFFSADDRKLISDFFGMSFSEVNSCLSSYDIDGLLFLLKNREKILPDEYFQLLSCSSLVYLNEAINDYIAYNIFENANGEINFKPNYDYYRFFPLIKISLQYP